MVEVTWKGEEKSGCIGRSNATANIKVAEARAKFYFDETQNLCGKIKSLETSLAQSKSGTEKLMEELKKKERDLGIANWEIKTTNHANDLFQRELQDVEEKNINDWTEYEEERNMNLSAIKHEMEQNREMTKSKLSVKKRLSTRRKLIQSVCTKLVVRVGASFV